MGKNIRKAGLDFNEGDLLLDAGRVLDPAALSLAAASNHPIVPLVRRPRVAILATGDELVSPGETYRPDQIIASNSFGLAEIIREAGGVPFDLGIAEDRLEALGDALDRAIAAGPIFLLRLAALRSEIMTSYSRRWPRGEWNLISGRSRFALASH